jgi:hypothetical protein
MSGANRVQIEAGQREGNITLGLSIQVAPMLDEQQSHIAVPGRARLVERGPPQISPLVDVDPRINQEPGGVEVIEVNRPAQRVVPARIIDRVDVVEENIFVRGRLADAVEKSGEP